MISPSEHPESDSRGRFRVLGAASVLALTLSIALVSSAGAERAKLLGKTRNAPSPNCPAKNVPAPSPAQTCQITGQVTGFQRSADGKRNLFKAKTSGKIVAWSIDLAKPKESERKTFGDAAQTSEFGKAPTAGISIIRRKPSGRFELKRSSPILRVGNFYGQKPTFTLGEPLKVKKGDVVALTTATWLPAFSVKGQDRNDVWVASRRKADCEIPNNVPDDERIEYFFDHTKPHRKVGSERKYQCAYDSARLLYWAYLAPSN